MGSGGPGFGRQFSADTHSQGAAAPSGRYGSSDRHSGDQQSGLGSRWGGGGGGFERGHSGFDRGSDGPGPRGGGYEQRGGDYHASGGGPRSYGGGHGDAPGGLGGPNRQPFERSSGGRFGEGSRFGATEDSRTQGQPSWGQRRRTGSESKPNDDTPLASGAGGPGGGGSADPSEADIAAQIEASRREREFLEKRKAQQAQQAIQEQRQQELQQQRQQEQQQQQRQLQEQQQQQQQQADPTRDSFFDPNRGGGFGGSERSSSRYFSSSGGGDDRGGVDRFERRGGERPTSRFFGPGGRYVSSRLNCIEYMLYIRFCLMYHYDLFLVLFLSHDCNRYWSQIGLLSSHSSSIATVVVSALVAQLALLPLVAEASAPVLVWAARFL